ncbi:MAG: Sulfur carrier protein adenylyltransferase [Chlamydiales bacterium]|nr:Sulfur carrier protein adenylyltransferase [Chlamydiales bacterium]
MGVKNIIGVDFDRVEITNLHRQILYSRKDLGKLKTSVCKEKIQECDEHINFVGHNLKVQKPKDLYSIIKNSDLIINPFSYVPLHHTNRHPASIVAKAALDMKKPCLTFGGSWIGPLNLPGKSPCYFCALHALSTCSDLNPENRSPHVQKRAFAPPIATCCSLAIFEAARFLSGCDQPQILKGIMQLDILSFANNNFFTLNQNHECRFCSPHTTQNTRDK